MMLNRDGPIPLYRQLYDILRERIEQGQFRPNEALPSENQLATMFNVSRITTRKALELLGNANLIIRQPGKGTFVRTQKIEEYQHSLRGFAEIMQAQHPDLMMDVVSFEMIPIPHALISVLELAPDAQVLHIKRIHSVKHATIAIAQIFLPFDLAKSLTANEIVTTPIYMLLTRQDGIVIDHATQKISAIPANEEVAEGLKIPLGSPVLAVKRVTYSTEGRPLEFIELYYPGERHELVVELRRNPS